MDMEGMDVRGDVLQDRTRLETNDIINQGTPRERKEDEMWHSDETAK